MNKLHFLYEKSISFFVFLEEKSGKNMENRRKAVLINGNRPAQGWGDAKQSFAPLCIRSLRAHLVQARV